jgi:predicted amidophosphoribosyltransferase
VARILIKITEAIKVFCPTCKKEVDRLANFCEFCGTKIPPIKNLTKAEQELKEKEFENSIITGKCSRDHKRVINLVEVPPEYKESGGIITRYCVECGEAIDEIIL